MIDRPALYNTIVLFQKHLFTSVNQFLGHHHGAVHGQEVPPAVHVRPDGQLLPRGDRGGLRDQLDGARRRLLPHAQRHRRAHHRLHQRQDGTKIVDQSKWEADGNCQHFNIVIFLYAVMVLSFWGHLHMMSALGGMRGVLKNQTK